MPNWYYTELEVSGDVPQLKEFKRALYLSRHRNMDYVACRKAYFAVKFGFVKPDDADGITFDLNIASDKSGNPSASLFLECLENNTPLNEEVLGLAHDINNSVLYPKWKNIPEDDQKHIHDFLKLIGYDWLGDSSARERENLKTFITH